MARVTVDAGNPPRLVRTSFPKQSIPTIMTRQTRAVLLFDGILGVFGKSDRYCLLPASSLDMSSARTVACLTPKLFPVIFWVSEGLAHDSVLEVLALIRMANDAGLTTRIPFQVLWLHECRRNSDGRSACDHYPAGKCNKHKRGRKIRMRFFHITPECEPCLIHDNFRISAILSIPSVPLWHEPTSQKFLHGLDGKRRRLLHQHNCHFVLPPGVSIPPMMAY